MIQCMWTFLIKFNITTSSRGDRAGLPSPHDLIPHHVQEKGIFVVVMQKDPAGLDPDSKWEVASNMKK